MKYYVYKCYIEVTYGYSDGAHYFEAWTKVAEADSIKEAMRFATEHAEADPLVGDRESYDGKAVVGLYSRRIALCGVMLKEIPPLPHCQVDYCVLDKDLGNSSEHFTNFDLDDRG